MFPYPSDRTTGEDRSPAHPFRDGAPRGRHGHHVLVARRHDRVRVDPRAERGGAAQAERVHDRERSDADARADLPHDHDEPAPDHGDVRHHHHDDTRANAHALVVNPALLFTGQTIWIVARSTGVASLVSLSLSLLTGMALRPKTLGWLSTNRAVSELHSYATVLWLPLGLAHVIAILFDPYSKVGVADLVIPFAMPYGAFAIGLGTLSLQLLVVVLVAAWSRDRLSRGQWLVFHRLSYLAFGAAFLHGVLSGTDLAYPWLTGVAWLVAAMLALAGTRRVLHALPVRA
jgi:sulfoxide reductase heme-binding subunit YedZ